MAELRRYEALMLSVPEITKDEAAELEKGFEKMVRDAKGSVVSFERWGKYRLAFPVRKKDYGVYFLSRFEVPEEGELLDELKSYFMIKVNDVVMRNMITRLDIEGSLVYQRPRSLEEAPTSRDVDSFLKENKMEGLLPGASSEPPKAAAPADTVSEATETEDAAGDTSDDEQEA